MIAKSGRWGHRPQRSAAVGVLTNRNMGEQNSIFKKLLREVLLSVSFSK
jgi:hypothetical protein